VKDPVCGVPESIRKKSLNCRICPSGLITLGTYWLQLSVNGYGIHGTNMPTESVAGSATVYKALSGGYRITRRVVEPGTPSRSFMNQ